MIKTTYQKELAISGTQRRGGNNNKSDVLKIQSWLTLYDMANPSAGSSSGVDGDFGSATEKAVMLYQKHKGITANGIVTTALFLQMCAPIQQAFEGKLAGDDLRQRVISAAHLHLLQSPFELIVKGQSNMGPWVRSYMDGHEGTSWFWCMGFVQAIIDQAASSMGKSFKTLMPLTYSCDTVGTVGIAKNLLTRFTKLRTNPALAKPGDIFLVQKTPNDWVHTGIIAAVGKDIFETIEGNTNDDGSNNGNRVCKRVRNFMKSKLDVFSIEPLVK